MEPKIVISGSKTISTNYVNAIKHAGGIPIYQYCPEYNEEYDGLILAGGEDMDPQYYNQVNQGSKGIDLERDEAELKILDKFVEAKKPVLGICRGHQTINVYFGGNLIQHMPNYKYHQIEGDSIHRTISLEDTFIYRLFGKEIITNSNHHQSIGRLGDNLIISQYSEDRVIEAVEHNILPIYGVQWHPERMSYEKYRKDAVDAKLLFEWFVLSCMRRLG